MTSSDTLTILAENISAPTLTFVRSHIEWAASIAPLTIGTEQRDEVALPQGVALRKLGRGRRPLASIGMRLGSTSRYWGPDRALRTTLAEPAISNSRILHIHFGTDATRYLANLEPAKHRRVFVTFHGYDVDPAGHDLRYVEAANSVMKDHNAHALFVTDALRERAVEFGLRPPISSTHYLGLDVKRIVERTGPVHSPFRFLSIGALRPKKGHADTIRALHALATSSTNSVELTIVGDGPLLPELEELISDLGLDRHVELVGWQTPAQVAELLANSDGLVMASRGDTGDGREGLPIALLEGLAANLIVIGTRHSGIPEALEHAPDAIIVDEGDVSQLHEAMGNALSRRPSTKNRSYVEERFGSVARQGHLFELYSSVSPAMFTSPTRRPTNHLGERNG